MTDENWATIKPCSKPISPSDYDEWSDALEWLDKNVVDFSTAIENDMKNYSSRRMFKNWRFVKALDGEIIFANGLISCVDMNDLKRYREFNKRGR
ncbi:hypothetical protein AAH678_16360 [Sodalis endosymbiont of Spalangia cameroni]|uniref:hypothetical protein n=1 Tax=Sodalis praecaptivus TaxID=1239307 RepID=UPI0031F8B62B